MSPKMSVHALEIVELDGLRKRVRLLLSAEAIRLCAGYISYGFYQYIKAVRKIIF